jgi:hypothetical protein
MVNEIDEIFASKPSGSGSGSGNANQPGSSATTTTTIKATATDANGTGKKKRKRKLRENAGVNVKGDSEGGDEEWGGIASDLTSSAPAPATSSAPASKPKSKVKVKMKPTSAVEVVDASKPARVELPKPPPRKKIKPTSSANARAGKDDEDDALFKDSRGTGPRMFSFFLSFFPFFFLSLRSILLFPTAVLRPLSPSSLLPFLVRRRRSDVFIL